MSEMKTATAAAIAEEAEKCALDDAKRNLTDPHGRWSNYRSFNKLWNSFSPETQEQASRESPLAYRLFVNAYLIAQGWKR